MYPEHSSYFNSQYIPNPYDCTMTTYVPPISSQTNRIYVNKNFVQPVQPPATKTVLVNPNFSRQVHVNPNFANKNVQTTKNTVFVNPNVFNKVGASKIAPPTPTTMKLPEISTSRPIITTKYSKINNYSINNLVNVSNDAIVKTKTKLIRRVQSQPQAITSTGPSRILSSKKVVNHYKPKQIISRHKLIRNNTHQKINNVKNIVKSKYKLVRSMNNVPKSPKIRQQLRKLSITMLNTPNTRFKLDNRTRRQSCTIIKSRYKLTKKAYMMRLDPQNSIIKNTKFKLIRSAKPKMAVVKHEPTGIKKTTTTSFARKKFTKRNLVKINKRKLQTNNIPCENYNRRGTCKGLASGKCSKKHDVNQIQICIWFLQGICRDDKCTLSHKASPEKMPTCKFYLEGICHKDNCPYLHVKLSKDAPVCRDFINGYCAKGLACDKRHQFLCPDFERDGKCAKKLCRYPHGKAVRQYKDTLLNVIARNRKSKAQRETNAKGKKSKFSLRAAPAPKVGTAESKENGGDAGDSKRYYECPSGVIVDHVVDEKSAEVQDGEDVSSIFDRPKLGALPSFISL